MIPSPLKAPKMAGQWGRPRPLHQYLRRTWDVARQDWNYEYPEKPGMLGGGSPDSKEDDEGTRRRVAGDELQWRREQDMAQDMDAQADDAPETKPESKGSGDEKNAFLEGFEEGYELGHKVGEKEAES